MIIKCPECGTKTDFGPKTKGQFLCEECEEELDPADALPRRKLKKKAKKSNRTLYLVLGGISLCLLLVLSVVAVKKGWFKGGKATSDEVADGLDEETKGMSSKELEQKLKEMLVQKGTPPQEVEKLFNDPDFKKHMEFQRVYKNVWIATDYDQDQKNSSKADNIVAKVGNLDFFGRNPHFGEMYSLKFDLPENDKANSFSGVLVVDIDGIRHSGGLSIFPIPAGKKSYKLGFELPNNEASFKKMTVWIEEQEDYSAKTHGRKISLPVTYRK